MESIPSIKVEHIPHILAYVRKVNRCVYCQQFFKMDNPTTEDIAKHTYNCIESSERKQKDL